MLLVSDSFQFGCLTMLFIVSSGKFPTQELTALFGTDWAIQNLAPPVAEILRHQSYLRRLTALRAFSQMAMEMDTDTARIEVLPQVLQMAHDNVSDHILSVIASRLSPLTVRYHTIIFSRATNFFS